MTPNEASIIVVQVNFETPLMVIDCLNSLSLERHACSRLKVVIVDNDSKDDSKAIILGAIDSNSWSSWVRLIDAGGNQGYASGNNIGTQFAMREYPEIDYLWLLNPDTIILPGAAVELISSLQHRPDTISGSRLEDPDGTKQISVFNFPSLKSELCGGFRLGLLDRVLGYQVEAYDISKPDWMAGASLMMSIITFAKLGEMDEGFFLYFEEVDYFIRARNKGVKCHYANESRVIHHVGGATGISNLREKQKRRPSYWFHSRNHFFLKNYGRIYLSIADFLWAVGYISWVTRHFLFAKNLLIKEPPHLLKDFFHHSVLNPKNRHRNFSKKSESING